MQVQFVSKELPREFLELFTGSRVTVELTFDVDEIHINPEEDSDDRVGGSIKEFSIERVTGVSGLSAAVERATGELRKLSLRSMGTNG